MDKQQIMNRINEEINRINNLIRIINEDTIPNTPEDLIRSLPTELKELLFKQWNAKQSPKWHPEGNSLKHILIVLKRAYRHYSDDPNMIMAALFHDLGKMDTYAINPKTGEPTAYGHENKSAEYLDQYRDWIESFDGIDFDEIKYLVTNHMKVKPSTWDSMKDIKKEPISSNPSFSKLRGFTDKLDGGGIDI
jgi:putative nucleotidyltransferase with HDIG domain